MWLLTIEEDKAAQMLHFCAFCMKTKRNVKRDMAFAEVEKVYEWGQVEDQDDKKKYKWLGQHFDLVHASDDSSKFEIQIKDYVPAQKKEKTIEDSQILAGFR